MPVGRRVSLTLEPPTEDVAESPWLWFGIGLAVLASAGLAIGLSQIPIVQPPLTSEFWATINVP